MRVPLVLGVVGRLVTPFALAFLPPLVLAIYSTLFSMVPLDSGLDLPRSDWREVATFALAMVGTAALGRWLTSLGVDRPVLRRGEALAVVPLTWSIVGACAAVPYIEAGLGPVDAMFESISGLTTTGATVLTQWDQSRAFFLWRAMTQWFGGLGVIALFVIVLPRLGIAGRQIFFFESSTAPSEAVSPSVRHGSRQLWIFYSALTALMALLLMLVAGCGPFTALVHSLTTLAAGGFSPNPTSIQGYGSPAMEWVMVPFMFIGGASFPLLLSGILRRRPGAVLADPEFRLYAAVSGLAIVMITVWLAQDGTAVSKAVRDSAFQVASLISSAGFASVDYERDWSGAIKATLVVVMVLGGCAGSAAGGAKQVRFLLVGKFLGRELTRVLHPRAVLPLRHGQQIVPREVLRAIAVLTLLYLLGYAVLGSLVAWIGVGPHGLPEGRSAAEISATELSTAYSASIACLSNVGPAFGPAGPMGGYAGFPMLSKLLLTLAMLIGRLEIVTVLALLHPDVWRNLRFSLPPRSTVTAGA